MSFFSSKKKILVVEDEPDIAESLDARLGLADYEVVIAHDGQEGVTKARAEKPDLILLDVMLPKIDGFEVCRILRSESATKNTPVIMLTALQSLGDVDKAFEVGATAYISKPFTNERLLAKVKKLLP